ncbi:MAG: hypothetical protein COB60_01225 [Flavobacteriaceae bacterium]|nr:MAG: hypothetical protein COB60_01225 [Flavobacteriaceae bacterium]
MKNFYSLVLKVTKPLTKVLAKKGTSIVFMVDEFTEQKILDRELLFPIQLTMGNPLNSQNSSHENSI